MTKVSCAEQARAKALITARGRSQGVGSPLKGEILFAVTFLSSFMSNLILAGPRGLGIGRRMVVTPEQASVIREERREAPSRDQGGERYLSTPSYALLVKDAQRSHRPTREEAVEILLGRLPDDAIRSWVAVQVAAGEFSRLNAYARTGAPDEVVLAGWQKEAAADLAAALEVDRERGSGAACEPSERCSRTR